ncbi:hypothetical protein Tco_0675658 [Tanacetum coccineum]
MLNNGDCMTSDQVPIAFIDHYTAFLGQRGVTSPMISTDLFCNLLLNDVAKNMVCEVSDCLGYYRHDVIKAVREFFLNEVLLKELNHTIIALTLKVATPMKINYYRPILYCNVLFKCISKILSNRMKDCLTGLVSLNQSAFVPGRRISDNILLTQELMHNYHLDRGPPHCAFKVNIQKAYDMVDWDFLKDVLTGGIGLRQGDPMSLYLFTIMMEILTLMLNRRVHESDSFTYHRHCSRLNIINLCFADDLFLFAHGDASYAQVIMDTLEEFKTASGLTPSLPKSMTYFCNVLNYVKFDILVILPFEEGKLPVKYLGVPLVPSRLLYRDCTELVEKALVFILPSYLMLDLEQSLRGLLWCQGEIQKGKAKVVWEGVCLPKNKGGLVDSHIQASRAFFMGNSISCPLSNGILNRDIYEVGFQLSAKVNNVIMNGNWLWLNDWHLKFSMLSNMDIPHLNPYANDNLYWRDLSNVEVGFSIAVVWDSIRPRSTNINWYNLVCNGTLGVWDHLKPYMRMFNIPSSLSLIVDFLVPLAAKKSARSIIVKLIFAAACYFIWHERNNRLFSQQKRTPDQVVDSIISTVQLKLISCKFKKSENVQRAGRRLFLKSIEVRMLLATFIKRNAC